MKRHLVLVVLVGILFFRTTESKATIYFNDGLSHNIDYPIDDYVYVDYEAPGKGTIVNVLSGGAVGYSMHGYNNCFINVSDGSVGSIEGHLCAYDSSKISISGGSIYGYLYAYESSQMHISGGSIDGHFRIYDNSKVDISAGSMYFVIAFDNSEITMSGGAISDDLAAIRSSLVNISGGLIGWDLVAYDSSRVSISGGSIGRDLWTYNSSQMDIFGGSIGNELIAYNDGTVTIHGFDFAVDGHPFGYGELTSIFGGDWENEPYRHLTGVLASGELIDNDFLIGNSAKIILVPEPATLLLLGLGVVLLHKKR